MESVSVKEAYDRIYRKAGYVPTSNIACDPNSKTALETYARKKALAELEKSDKYQVESCVKRLKECFQHVSLGDAAALQILEHIGIFLSEADL